MASENKLKFDSLKAKTSSLLKDAIQNDRSDSFFERISVTFDGCCENDMKNIVELTYRGILLELLSKKADMKTLDRVFQLSIDAAMEDVCPGNLPVLVLQDMFDGSTLNECESIFTLVESRVEIFKQELFFKTCKNHLLRSCNDLLRRLSRSQNTVFCGRILLFLARIFPLSERSGLNIISEFNLDNTTIFSSKDDAFNDSSLEKDDLKDDDGEPSTSPFATDYNLYRKFWSLQDYFRNPVSCYNKLHWRHFTSYAIEILTVFGSFKSDDANSSKWKQTESASTDGSFTYFAKYLTSPKLLELEMSDSNFRRYLLIQFLILFQYLSSTVKFKLEAFVLTEEQQSWIKDTSVKIYKLLEDTPPDGAVFSKNIEKILKREEYWNSWKNEGCPDFKSSESEVLPRQTSHKKRMGDEMDQPNKVFIGNPELTKLWNICPDNWEACRSPRRKFIPSIKKFFANAIEQSNPENQIESQYKDVNDPKFGWKALRLLSMKSSNFFAQNNTVQFKNLPEYLELMIQKIPKETSSVIQESTPSMDADTAAITEETLEDANEEILPSEEEMKEVEKPKKNSTVSKTHITALANVIDIQNDWQLLAKHLEFKDDEIAYFAETYPSLQEQTEKMLIVWSEQDHLGGCLSAFKCALLQSGLLNHTISILPAS